MSTIKKNLIYYISFGSYYYREMVKLSILSILDRTDFQGDIVVLSDHAGIPGDIEKINSRIRVIDVFKDKPFLREYVSNKYNIFCIKSIINQIIDITQYNYILYLDGDTLLNIKNLDMIFNLWATQNIIQIASHDGWDIEKEKPSTGSQFLTKLEISKWRDLGFCAGIIGFPGNELGISLLNKWYEYNKTGNFELDDQGALTAILLRYFKDKHEICKLYNPNKFLLKDICHYHGGNKKMFWEHSRILLNHYRNHINIDGKWSMIKPCENIVNEWEISNNLVVVDNPCITGFVQATSLGIYIWWNAFDGFEKITPIDEKTLLGDSFKGGESCFGMFKD